MAKSPSERAIKQALRRIAKKNPGVTYVVIRASNGEVAIVPESKISPQ